MQFDTARVSITASNGEFVVSLEHGPKLLAQWRVESLREDLGREVEDRLAASPHAPKAKAVIFCGDRQVELDRLREVAGGLPEGYEFVTCMADRKNCPGSCPNMARSH